MKMEIVMFVVTPLYVRLVELVDIWEEEYAQLKSVGKIQKFKHLSNLKLDLIWLNTIIYVNVEQMLHSLIMNVLHVQIIAKAVQQVIIVTYVKQDMLNIKRLSMY